MAYGNGEPDLAAMPTLDCLRETYEMRLRVMDWHMRIREPG